MKKHYLKNTWRSVCKGGLLAAVLFSASALKAQLSGSYTINSASATGGTNYQTWAAFASALGTSGVSGPVKVTVSGTHSTTTAITFNAISGVSATNTIEIDGNGTTLSSSSSAEAILFNGADRVSITNLTINITTSLSSAIGIRFTNASDDNTIQRVTIQNSAQTTGSSVAGAYIAFSGSNSSLTTLTTTHNGSRNLIKACTLRTTNSNNPGPAYGILDQQGTSSYTSTASNNTFEGNVIQNFFATAIYARYTNGDQFIGNDISRTNAGSGTPVNLTVTAYYHWYSYGTNRSTAFQNNKIYDLPYKNASASSTTNYINQFRPFDMWYNYGRVTGGNPVLMQGNTFNDIMAYSIIRGDMYYNEVLNIVNNEFRNIQTSVSGTSYMFYIYFGRDHNIENNRIVNCSLSTASTGSFYAYYIYYCYNTYRTRNTWNDNVISNNYSGGSFFSTYFYFTYGSWNVYRNRIVNNRTSSTSGTFYGFYFYYNNNLDVVSNIIADNLGYFNGYHCYSYNFQSGYTANFRQNTLKATSSSYQFYFMYGWVIQEAQSRLTFDGNITEISSNYYVYPAYFYNTTPTNILSVNWNTFHFPQIVNQFWYMGTSSFNSYNAWVTSGIPGSGNNYSNPNFRNPSTGDYRSNSFETQNNVPTVTWASTDRSGKSRQIGSSDRGAYEDSMNIRVSSTTFKIASQVCAGYESPVDVTVHNTYTDTIYNFNVAYSINGGTPVRQLVTNRILPGDSLKISFNQPMVLPIAGNTTIRIFLDVNDDRQIDNRFEYTTFVKPAPGGGRYIFSNKTTSPNTATYQLSRPFDVTVVNVPVYYNVPAPRVYNNSTYGTSAPANWFASAQAYTKSGKLVPGATLTAPSGTTDLEVKFETSDATLEDSTLTIVLKVSDLNNGCDTFIKRNILIFPSATPDFKFPNKICDGSDVLFENLSDIKPSAALEYFWNFGTGVAADTSNAPEPVFRFPKSGKYDVVLTAKTMPYGFIFTKKIQVTVNDVPTVDFNKTNACLGQDIKFTSVINPSSATANWDFGNGVKKTGTNVTYQYPKAGSYMVKLTADLNGCVAEQSARVYQFETPTAGFNLKSGICDNDMFSFTNTSAISGGLIGSFWDFNDNGSISTDDNPTYKFSAAGKKTVKLTVKSEFGCEAVSTKEVEVRESPKVSFTNTPACSITPTEFINTTNNVTGTVANYNWNMGDGTVKTSKDYTHTSSSSGPKTVTLTVKLNNGCENKISKELNVLTQPKAAFAAADV